jgi:hypothetical protein
MGDAAGAGFAGAGILASAFFAAKSASEARKGIKARAKADIGVLTAQTKAQIEALNANYQAERDVTRASSEASAQAALYEAGIHDTNAAFARIAAKDALARGDYETFFSYQQAGLARGTVRAQIAGTGVDVNRGSAVDLQRDVMLGADLDALAIRQQAQREAYGEELQGYDQQQQAAMARQTAASTRKVTAINLAGLAKRRDVTRKGLKDTQAANIEAIRESARAGMGFSPMQAALSTALTKGAEYGSQWYMSHPSSSYSPPSYTGPSYSSLNKRGV